MEIIRRYVPDINSFEDKHMACEQLILKFMNNYSSIVYESESQFICKYFMSAILAFCADIDFQNNELLERFLRFFVERQTGIWDIWSVHQFEQTQWTAVEKFLDTSLVNLRTKTGFEALKYIIEKAHKLNIEFIDPMDSSLSIRFVDFPRFDAIDSKSELWRNLHHPIIDCTLLPESPHILQLLLQFGANIPTPDYQSQHFIHRIQHLTTNTKTKEVMLKKLFWIKFVTNDISFQSQLYKDLSIVGNDIIEELKNQFEYHFNDCILDSIPKIPSLKQMVRYWIRKTLRPLNRLPQGLDQLEIIPILRQYLNLIYI